MQREIVQEQRDVFDYQVIGTKFGRNQRFFKSIILKLQAIKQSITLLYDLPSKMTKTCHRFRSSSTSELPSIQCTVRCKKLHVYIKYRARYNKYDLSRLNMYR